MFKKIGFGLLLAAVVATVGVGAAFAQGATPPAEAPVEGERPAWHQNGPGGPRGGHLETVAEALGMTVDELHEALADGQTVAELAEAQGVALEDIAAALVAVHAERIQQAVDDGRLTQEEADEKLAEMEDRILEGLESGEFGGRGGPCGPGDPRGGHLETVAEALGMTVDELHEALADGQTVAELAEAQGVALEDIAAALVAVHAERIQQAVDDGRLTQEEADEKLAEMADRILEGLESGEFGGSRGPGGMPGGPREGGLRGPRPLQEEAPVL
jgi:uncharacterized protein (DUF433 family)